MLAIHDRIQNFDFFSLKSNSSGDNMDMKMVSRLELGLDGIHTAPCGKKNIKVYEGLSMTFSDRNTSSTG